MHYSAPVDDATLARRLGSGLRARRTGRGWTLDEASERLGVSRRLLVQIEQAEANPSLSTLLRVAAGFGIGLSDLLPTEGRPAVVVHDRDRSVPLWRTSSGSEARLLVATAALELWDWRLEPGAVVCRMAPSFVRFGSFELPAARLSCNVTYPATGRNPIDRFYGRSRTEQKQLRTEPISVRVRDLPPAPSDFSNVVGRVAINTSIDEAELITGNSATQTIFITSNGNLRGFTPPVPEIDGVKIYDDQSKLMLNDRGNEIETSLRMNRAFVPLRSGKLDVPGFSFSYFDPQSERYRTASSPSVRLKVRANPDEPQLKAERSAPAPPEEKTKSADPLSPPRSDSLRGAPTPSPWLVPTMAIALPLAALGLLTFRRRGARRGPTKSLRSTLAPLKDAADLDAELVERTMRGVMALRGGEVFRSLSIDELNHELGAQGVASEDRNHVLGWLRWAEAIRYGGVTRVPPAKKTDLVALLQRLDRYLEDDHAAPARPGAHPP